MLVSADAFRKSKEAILGQFKPMVGNSAAVLFAVSLRPLLPCPLAEQLARMEELSSRWKDWTQKKNKDLAPLVHEYL
jgi:hypothetical protein